MGNPTLGERSQPVRVHSVTGSFEILVDGVPETEEQLVTEQKTKDGVLGWYSADGEEVYQATKPTGGVPNNHRVRKHVPVLDDDGNEVLDRGHIRAEVVVHDQNGERYQGGVTPSINENNMPPALLDKWRALGAETLAWAKPLIDAELETV